MDLTTSGVARSSESLNFLDLPDCMIEQVLENLTYDEIAKSRIICMKINIICQSLLNRGFVKIIRRHNANFKAIKSQLPRRESERRNHPLAKHADILTCIETRISMLSMTYSKYIEKEVCCFIPGKVIDEVMQILFLVENISFPLRAHDVLQELRDISSMAIEHFDEHIVDGLKRLIGEHICPKNAFGHPDLSSFNFDSNIETPIPSTPPAEPLFDSNLSMPNIIRQGNCSFYSAISMLSNRLPQNPFTLSTCNQSSKNHSPYIPNSYNQASNSQSTYNPGTLGQSSFNSGSLGQSSFSAGTLNQNTFMQCSHSQSPINHVLNSHSSCTASSNSRSWLNQNGCHISCSNPSTLIQSSNNQSSFGMSSNKLSANKQTSSNQCSSTQILPSYNSSSIATNVPSGKVFKSKSRKLRTDITRIDQTISIFKAEFRNMRQQLLRQSTEIKELRRRLDESESKNLELLANINQLGLGASPVGAGSGSASVAITRCSIKSRASSGMLKRLYTETESLPITIAVPRSPVNVPLPVELTLNEHEQQVASTSETGILKKAKLDN
ncbi:uncharacterized protein LOC128724668 [Anopheles nili]|uniref:uncharacterized protein LOC128724668 n=1 Tax=Anopheles nili TaxID=185578 RepID=UPI00237A3017|nr:uncharacterized protein LOC128724668 [Anopheles nili]